MGTAQSHERKNKHETDYHKLINTYKLPKVISKEDFIRILSCVDRNFVTRVWNFTVGSDLHCTESQFNDLVENCRFRTGKRWLRYLMTIAGIKDKADQDQMRLLFAWVSFSCDGVYDTVSKSLTCMSSDSCDVNECLTWVDRNLPEIGIDLARYMHRTLMCQSNPTEEKMADKMTEVIIGLCSDLITPHIMLLLCASLPMSFKTSDKGNGYLFENVSRWKMLYNSDRHGLSASKFKENSFDYDGNLIVLVKCDSGLFCLASDIGLKEDWHVYGGVDSRLLQLAPIFKKLISGTRSGADNKSGIIYSHFTAKTGRRGLFVGHNPPQNSAFDLDEDLTKISILGRAEPIRLIEVWAVGSGVEDKISKLNDVRHWEKNEVNKHKNRKIKAEDWTDNPDREILGMGGVNVRHADLVGGIDRDLDAPK